MLGVGIVGEHLAVRVERDAERVAEAAENQFAAFALTVDADHVYVVWASPDETTLAALDHHGQVAWRRNLGPFSSKHGFGTSPVLYKDLVILAMTQEDTSEDSTIIAVDRKGVVCMDYNTEAMARGAADANGRFEVFWGEELTKSKQGVGVKQDAAKGADGEAGR